MIVTYTECDACGEKVGADHIKALGTSRNGENQLVMGASNPDLEIILAAEKDGTHWGYKWLAFCSLNCLIKYISRFVPEKLRGVAP